MTPRIRALSDRDLADLLPMIRAFSGPHPEGQATTEALLARDFLGSAPWLHGLVAEHDLSLIGYAALCPTAQLHAGRRGLDVHHLYVRPQWRNRGAGRRLLEACAQKAATLGCAYVTMDTGADALPAQAAGRAAGFRPASGTRMLREV